MDLSSFWVAPVDEAHSPAEDHDDQTESDDDAVDPLLELSLGDGLQVEQGWECEGNRRAGQRSQYSQELVDLVAHGHREHDSERHQEGPRQILRPLPRLRLGPRAVQRIFHDDVRWIEHQRVREQQIEAKENDDRVLEGVWGHAVQLRGDDRLQLRLPNRGAVETKCDIHRSHEGDHCGNNPKVCFGVLRNILHWEDDSDSLK